MRPDLFRDSRALVADFKSDLRRAAHDVDPDPFSSGRQSNGVVDQIDEDQEEDVCRVSRKEGFAAPFLFKMEAGGCRFWTELFGKHGFEFLEGELKRSGRVLFSRSEEHTSELQSRENLVCRLL